MIILDDSYTWNYKELVSVLTLGEFLAESGFEQLSVDSHLKTGLPWHTTLTRTSLLLSIANANAPSRITYMVLWCMSYQTSWFRLFHHVLYVTFSKALHCAISVMIEIVFTSKQVYGKIGLLQDNSCDIDGWLYSRPRWSSWREHPIRFDNWGLLSCWFQLFIQQGISILTLVLWPVLLSPLTLLL